MSSYRSYSESKPILSPSCFLSHHDHSLLQAHTPTMNPSTTMYYRQTTGTMPDDTMFLGLLASKPQGQKKPLHFRKNPDSGTLLQQQKMATLTVAGICIVLVRVHISEACLSANWSFWQWEAWPGLRSCPLSNMDTRYISSFHPVGLW